MQKRKVIKEKVIMKDRVEFEHKRQGKLIQEGDVDDNRELRRNYEGEKQEERITLKTQFEDFRGDKRARELQVAQRFAGHLNDKCKKDYEAKDKEYQDVDVEAISCSDPKDKLLLQITMADYEPWGKLADSSSFQRHVQDLEQEHRSILKQAIQSKKNKLSIQQRAKLILLLDGRTYFKPEELENFKLREAEFLQTSGFLEIWYVGDSFAPIRLFPLKSVERMEE